VKIMSVAGAPLTPGVLPTGNTNGIKVSGVSDSDDGSTVVFYSRNVTAPAGGSGVWATNATPLFGNRGFVIFRKGGDGAVYLLPKQLTATNLIGTVTTNTTFQ
jgi:hypothetical protein